jgi:DNA-binding HxlR family transcriptional regulator
MHLTKIMERQTFILKLLFENRKLHYRGIVDFGIHPKYAKQDLEELRIKGLIKEEGRVKRVEHGRKLFYSLTEKGRAAYIRIAFDTADKALKDIKEISDAILSDPKKLEEWRKMSHETFYATKKPQDKPLDESMQLTDTEMYKIYGPLYESYENLHIIIHLLSLPPPLHYVPMFIGMVDDSICFIPNDFLEDKGFLGPVALRLRPSMSK